MDAFRDGPVARIDRRALALNLGVARARAAGSRVLAVVKADAYGHGALWAARAFAAADGLAVARTSEALVLRRAGIDRTILVLGGFSDREALAQIAAERLDAVVHAHQQVEMLRSRHEGAPVRVWVKVDTGMHRLGFPPAELPAVWNALAHLSSVAQPVHLMSHFARADEPDGTATARQIACFDEALAGLGASAPPPASLANSAAVLEAPAAHREWVRPGVMLYGIAPMVGGRAADHGLRPAMTLTAPLVAVKTIEAGSPVGYGGVWTAPARMRLGLAAIGYADGYPRHAPSGTPVLVGGRRAALAGRVSMDLIAIDLRGCPEARAGDPVTLWGDGLPVEEVAEAAGTIGYELVTRLGPRVERIVR
ncbi:MAG: alanine racemase [Immundisolibacterales bacterium]|nr:alanine racemase [Immundisolibacterales bacterium]